MTADLITLITPLELPQANLNSLSFCRSSSAASVRSWVESLPVTQMNRTGSMLYKSVPEIPRLVTSAANRADILEALRPTVQQTIQGLTRHFLDLPLTHSEAAMKTAIAAQALQRHMSVGYCQVVKELLQTRPAGNFKSTEKKILGLALHRALSGLGLQFLRSSQTYTQPTTRLWLEFNSLYRIAEATGLLKFPCLDPVLKSRAANTFEHAYSRIALFSCARPNQLTPREMRMVYDLTENWANLVQLEPFTDSGENLYGVDLGSNLAPCYKGELAEPQTPQYRDLNLRVLLDAIAKQQENTSETQAIVDIPATLPAHLLQHLLTTWGKKLERVHPRNRQQGMLEASIGLTNIHFHLANQKAFKEFIHGATSSGSFFSISGEDEADPWDNAFDSEGLGRNEVELGITYDMAGNNKQPDAAPVSAHNAYQVHILDYSSDGYRLDWRTDVPAQVKAGEIVSLREPGRNHFRLGVIRWAKQHSRGTQLGIQVLAHKMKAAAAQQLQKVGDDNVYMRAILATSSRNSDDYDCIITAAHPFREKNKVRIRDGEQSYSALLSELQFSTASVSVFRFRAQTLAGDAVGETGTGSSKSSRGNRDFSTKW